MQVDAMNEMLCGTGHNIRKILARIRTRLCLLTGDARTAVQGFLLHPEAVPIPQPTPMAA